MDDPRLLEAINDPDELGASVVISDGSVTQGNHRIAEALSRLADPNNSAFVDGTQILATINGDLP